MHRNVNARQRFFAGARIRGAKSSHHGVDRDDTML